MHRKKEGRLKRRFLACAMLIASAGGVIAPGSWTGAAADEAPSPDATPDRAERLDEDSFRAPRLWRGKQKARDEAVIKADEGDAKRFAARIKRHQIQRFVHKKREFRKHQLRLEKQRRFRRARTKARQFAAARRHVAKHARHRNVKPKVHVQHRYWRRLTQKAD